LISILPIVLEDSGPLLVPRRDLVFARRRLNFLRRTEKLRGCHRDVQTGVSVVRTRYP